MKTPAEFLMGVLLAAGLAVDLAIAPHMWDQRFPNPHVTIGLGILLGQLALLAACWAWARRRRTSMLLAIAACLILAAWWLQGCTTPTASQWMGVLTIFVGFVATPLRALAHREDCNRWLSIGPSSPPRATSQPAKWQWTLGQMFSAMTSVAVSMALLQHFELPTQQPIHAFLCCTALAGLSTATLLAVFFKGPSLIGTLGFALAYTMASLACQKLLGSWETAILLVTSLTAVLVPGAITLKLAMSMTGQPALNHRSDKDEFGAVIDVAVSADL